MADRPSEPDATRRRSPARDAHESFYTDKSYCGADEVAQAAIKALVALNAKDSVPVILNIISGEIPTNDCHACLVWRAAIEAVSHLGDATSAKPLIAVIEKAVVLNGTYWGREIGIAAADAFVKMGGVADIELLAPILKRLDQSTNERSIFTTKGERKINTFAGAMCRLIAACGDARAVDVLIDALDGESDSVPQGAVVALGEMKDKRAFGPLVLCKERGMPWVVDALVKIDGPGAVAPLCGYIGHSYPLSDGYIVRAIGAQRAPQASQVLKQSLQQMIFDSKWSTEPGHSELLEYIDGTLKDGLTLPRELPLSCLQ